jgi:MFS family permease
LVLAFLISGTGLIGLGLATSQQTIIAAAVVNGLGVGLMLPCMLAWTMSLLTLEQRGRGAGGFTTFFFLGQFVSPLLLLAISQQTGGLPSAVMVLGIATLLFTVLAFVARFVVAKPLAD